MSTGLAMTNLVHGWFCERPRCGRAECSDVIKALVRMEHHLEHKSCTSCRTRKLWARLDMMDPRIGQSEDNQARYDRSKPYWRINLLDERVALRWRHLQLMRRWRGIVHCIGPLRRARARAAQRRHAPEGAGHKRPHADLASLRMPIAGLLGLSRAGAEGSDMQGLPQRFAGMEYGTQPVKRAARSELFDSWPLDISKVCNGDTDCAALLVWCL